MSCASSTPGKCSERTWREIFFFFFLRDQSETRKIKKRGPCGSCLPKEVQGKAEVGAIAEAWGTARHEEKKRILCWQSNCPPLPLSFSNPHLLRPRVALALQDDFVAGLNERMVDRIVREKRVSFSKMRRRAAVSASASFLDSAVG